MTTDLHQAQDLETALIGAAVLGEVPVTVLTNDVGLRPHHFAQPTFGEAWAAIEALADKGLRPEAPLVISELGIPAGDPRRQKLYGATSQAALPAQACEFATRIIGASHLRHAQRTAAKIVEVAARGDVDAMARIAELAEGVVRDESAPTRLSLDERVQNLWEHADPDKVPELAMSWPWWEIDDLTGGFEPAEFTLVGGVTGHGKSILVDQIVEHVVDKAPGSTACLYLTEMREKTRDLRAISRAMSIPYERVRLGNRQGGLTAADHAGYRKGMNRVEKRAIEIEKVGARTADDLAREIRRRRWTVAVVDLLNAVNGPARASSMRERVEHNVKALTACAQESGCHIVGVNHLSPKARMGMDEYPKEPVLTDFRESTQLGDLTHNALMIYLKPETYTDSDGTSRERRSNVAKLILAKAKEGETGDMNLVADFKHMRFRKPTTPGTVGA